ncbi:glycosyl transferase family protein [Blastomonas sp. AAP53]|uniref:glycosyl transferase family protein n=1 Tax=Blastomonas sp. AAP53 TaxID=1248760 RepID=UPI00030B0DF3|nr:glycosyl transferase family protein [Blastomonas sp. AAP53]
MLLRAFVSLSDFAAAELLLFAGIWFFIGALDDLALDLVWIVQWLRARGRGHARRLTVAAACPSQAAQGPPRHAVFVPAWDEADVIGDMVAHCLGRWQGDDYRLYVGGYANDPATKSAALRGARGDQRLRIVPLDIAGPTSKADCLNRIWHAMQQDETAHGFRYRSIVLHDAEDVVHPAELLLYDKLLADHAFVQIPVHPLVDPAAPLISGHYADEFAEAHARGMPVRSHMGVALPCAGVGCAFDRATLQSLADASGDGSPFATDSLTEDYELGIRIHEAGGRGCFVRAYDDRGDMVATRAYFPGDLSASVRQKTRWMIGIALSGWDRTGWGSGVADIWMRARDRRSALAAVVLVAGYLGLVLWLLVGIGAAFGLHQPAPLDPAFRALLIVNGAMLAWRLAIRAWCTGWHYGWRQACWSLPRALVSNIIAVMAARKALAAYAASLQGGAVHWDKTRHHIPPAPDPAADARPTTALVTGGNG